MKAKSYYPEVQLGKITAEYLSYKLSLKIDFMWFENNYYSFMVTRYNLYKIVGINGEVIREKSISDKWGCSSEKVYYQTDCNFEQIFNGMLEWLITNKMTQGDMT